MEISINNAEKQSEDTELSINEFELCVFFFQKKSFSRKNWTSTSFIQNETFIPY